MTLFDVSPHTISISKLQLRQQDKEDIMAKLVVALTIADEQRAQSTVIVHNGENPEEISWPERDVICQVSTMQIVASHKIDLKNLKLIKNGK